MATNNQTTNTGTSTLGDLIGDFGVGVKVDTASILLLTGSIAALVILIFACLYAYKKSI